MATTEYSLADTLLWTIQAHAEAIRPFASYLSDADMQALIEMDRQIVGIAESIRYRLTGEEEQLDGLSDLQVLREHANRA